MATLLGIHFYQGFGDFAQDDCRRSKDDLEVRLPKLHQMQID
jgi:hypothetical protein